MDAWPISLPGARSNRRARLSAAAAAALEAVVLALVVLSPWAFGAVEPACEAALYAGVALVTLLWGARALLDGALPWRPDPVAVCLAGLFLLGVFQIAPLPRPVLALLSPGTSALFDELLPNPREQLSPPAVIPPAAFPAGRCLSLYPAATRQELLRVLAAFLLFGAVRANVASAASLRRLAAVATANGAALSLFALVQFLSSPRNTLYWTWPAPGSVYGPFICRNHFPYYVNVCFGLGLGLLLALLREGRAALGRPARGGPFSTFPDLLQDPAALWVATGLGVMLAATACCLSRGGLVALAAGLGVALAARAAGSAAPGRGPALLVVLAVALGLTAWFGVGPLRQRYATLWQADPADDGRGSIWADTATLVPRFPVGGTGYGTFPQVELLTRRGPRGPELIVDHAHNDFLEVLVEGGVPGLLFTLAAVGLVGRHLARALRRNHGTPAGDLVLGLVLAGTALVVHSAFDFGLHIPAIAVLAVVACAHAGALADDPGHAARPEPAPGTSRAGGPARMGPLLAMTGAAALASVLLTQGWRMAAGQSCRLAAYAVSDAPPAALSDAAADAASDRRLALFEAALRACPGRADWHLEAARAYLAGGRPSDDEAAGPDDGENGPVLPPDRRRRDAGLAHFVVARDLSPLEAQAHLRLALHAPAFARADPPEAYLRRARLTFGFDARLLHLAAALDLADGRRDQALAGWRHTLELSEALLPLVLERGRGTLTDAEWLDAVLPPRPRLLLDAADRLHPERDSPARQPYLERAARLLAEAPRPRAAADARLLARAREELGDLDAAATAWNEALAAQPAQPDQPDIRLRLARLFVRQGRPERALPHLEALLARPPMSPEAEKLLTEVRLELARRRP